MSTTNSASIDPHTSAVPFAVLEPNRAKSINLRDLWAYRELLYFLIWRDVKIRYKQTLLGAAWAIIQPLLTMIIFTLIFSRVAKIDSDGIPYPVFALAGLLPWTYFANAIAASGNSIVGSAHLITKVYFPRLLIPTAAVCAGLVDLLTAFPILVALMLYYHVAITWKILWLLPLMLLTALLALGIGLWLSALNVKYRDVKFAIPFLIQIWMYLSPIAYPFSAIPTRLHTLYALNPFVGLIESFRSALFLKPLDVRPLAVASVSIVIIFLLAARHFRKTERSFADII